MFVARSGVNISDGGVDDVGRYELEDCEVVFKGMTYEDGWAVGQERIHFLLNIGEFYLDEKWEKIGCSYGLYSLLEWLELFQTRLYGSR